MQCVGGVARPCRRHSATGGKVVTPYRPSRAWLSGLVQQDKQEQLTQGKKPAEPRTSSSGCQAPNYVAAAGYNRWLQVPCAAAVSGVCGSNYAWSAFNAPLSRELGVVAAASGDWPLTAVLPMFSVATVGLGLGAATFGKWIDRVGPRQATLAGATAWGSGLALGGVGVAVHSLPLTYLGYGVLGGVGIGIGYVVPIGVLMRWFPDRRGLAAGLGVLGFGGGAALAAPFNEALMRTFRVAPHYLGPAAEVDVSLENGLRVVDVAAVAADNSNGGSGDGGEKVEVVVATAADLDLSGWGASALQEGVYIVGSGDTGVAATFGTLGATYFSVMALGAMFFRLPSKGWTPDSHLELPQNLKQVEPEPEPEPDDADAASATSRRGAYVHVDMVHKTPQFWLLLAATAGNAVGGTIILSSAKLMMAETFGSTMPAVADAAFCASFVSALSLANMGGRLGWATVSDRLGRRNTLLTFGMLGVPACVAVPQWTAMASADALSTTGSTIPLVGFYSSSLLLISMYGGIYALLPAFAADLYGARHVTAIFGRLMLAAPVAAVTGPSLLAILREKSYRNAAHELAAVIPAPVFEEKFGAPPSAIAPLLENHVVTIPQLLEVAPAGTVDPTPFLYDSTMLTAAGIIAVATCAAAMIGPVPPRFFEVEQQPPQQLQARVDR